MEGLESPIQSTKRARLTDTETKEGASLSKIQDLSEMEFRKMLYDIAKGIGEDDLKTLKELCSDVYELIPKGDLEKKKRAFDVFQYLREETIISVDNTKWLKQLLKDIEKPYLVEKFVSSFLSKKDDGKPSKPEGTLNVISINAQSCKLKWNPPCYGDSTIIGYIIEQRDSTQTEWTTVSDQIPPDVTSYDVTNLKLSTEYYFRVCAEYAVGRSEYLESNGITITCKPSKPEGLLNISDIDRQSCKLKWNPPKDDDGSKILKYVIQQSDVMKTEWTTVSDDIPPDVTSYNVKNLNPETIYYFRVCAKNAVGTSEYLTSIAITTKGKLEFTREMEFRKMLFDIAKEIGKDELKSLKQLCRVYQLVQIENLENKKAAYDVFEYFFDAAIISVNNTEWLERLLTDIQQAKLVKDFVDPYKEKKH